MAEETAAAAPPAPIIIKRIKKGGHGHHGGAWKVAYADFVTAMMAFFLLLWLINVTTPEQKRGLAEYFTPTIGIKDSMGIGFKGGKNPTPEGRSRNDLTQPGLVLGQPRQGPLPTTPDSVPAVNNPEAVSTAAAPSGNASSSKQDESKKDTQDDDEFKMASEEVRQSLEQDSDLKSYRNNVIVENTPEGLKIDLIDDEKKPMFVPGTATLTEMGKKVLDSMSAIILKTPNNIVIKGHTDASGVTANPQYTNWELSADRANAARRFLFTTQLQADRVTKVVGMADRELLLPSEPNSPRNRRVTIVLMRGSYFRDPREAPTTRSLLSVPDAKLKKPKPKTPPPPKEEPIPKNGPSIFDPAAANQGQKLVVPKAPGTETRPELHLPTPRPAEEPKKAASAKSKQDNTPVPALPIFDSASPGQAPVMQPTPGTDDAPELHLSVPSPVPQTQKTAPASNQKKSDDSSDNTPPPGSIFDPASGQ